MRVLICVKNTRIKKSIEKLISTDKSINWVIDVAWDVEEAQYYVDNIKYRLIIIDLWLVEEMVFSLIRKIRLSEEHAPIIVFEEFRDVLNKISALEAGADAYLTLVGLQKTFNLKELKEVSAALTKRKSVINQKIISFGDVEYDFNRKDLTVGENTVILTGTETRIMDFFCQNRGIVSTRLDISDEIYNERTLGSVESITTFICKLRKKLGRNRIYIRTIRRVGYILD